MHDPTNDSSALKRALLALKDLRTRLDASERARTEPIAIVGLGCRFPGGAVDPDAYWRLLRGGGSAVREIPPERWNAAAFYAPDRAAPGKMYCTQSGFLSDPVDTFDAHFFGIAPREAVSMDPQQRLVLEVAWEALEHAGIAPDGLSGTKTGVYVGISTSDYENLRGRIPGALEAIDAYTVTGMAHSVACGRLAYILGLQGPNFPIDTACSSSLVAVHLAAASLRSGESDLALAGGVNLILSPESTVYFSKLQALSPSGRCATFDSSADGYVRGEGCGVLVLKRLSEALANRDTIHAVILGSAVNHDGRASGLTVPNAVAQQAVIREALAAARVAPSEVDYVEAHGTGTPLGDPIEVRSLAAVLGQGRPAGRSVALGSVKTNIGHLEAAAGAAGLIKVALALEHRELPPHLHLTKPTPHLAWDSMPFTIPLTPTPIGASSGRSIAGVSSFGVSGTNAHVILAEAPIQEPPRPTGFERPLHILPLSAKRHEALVELASRYARDLREHPERSVADVCHTASVGRAHLPHRLAVVTNDATELRGRLESFALGQETPGLVHGHREESAPLRPVFLFTGQGSQYPGMGRVLYQTQPVFREVLDRCDDTLRAALERPLLSVLWGEAEGGALLDQTAYTQPALFALQMALVALWRSWGVEPTAVIGHSVGEYAAACTAGVFSLEDGARLLAERGRLMQGLPRDGEMVALFTDEARVLEALGPYRRSVSIAAINGPTEVVISGARDDVLRLVESLGAQGVKSRSLAVSHAFHSPLMDPILDDFERAAARVPQAPPSLDLVSNLTGEVDQGALAEGPAYWRRHLRAPVRFAQGIGALVRQGHRLFVEIGPQPTLLGMGRRCAPDTDAGWLPSLRQGRDDWAQLLASLGELYARGGQVSWTGFDRPYARSKVVLPTYPFQRERFWWDDTPSERPVPPRPPLAEAEGGSHPLLGRRLRSPALKDLVFATRFDCRTSPWLAGHVIYDRAIVAGTTLLSMALEAATRLLGPGTTELRDVSFLQPIVLDEEAPRAVQLVWTPDGAATATFEISSAASEDDESWTRHVTGTAVVESTATPPTAAAIEAWQSRCARSISMEDYDRSMEARGYRFGPSFRWLAGLWVEGAQALGKLEADENLTREATLFRLHPGFLDACIRVMNTSSIDGSGHDDAYVPVGIDRLRFHGRSAGKAWCFATERAGRGAEVETSARDYQIVAEDGTPLVELEGLRAKRAPREALLRAVRHGNARQCLYQVAWRPAPAEPSQVRSQSRGTWLLLLDGAGVGVAAAALLEKQGDRVIRVEAGHHSEALGPDRFRVAAHREDLQRLLRELKGTQLRGVVHLWNLDLEHTERTAGSPWSGLELGTGRALDLAQGLSGGASVSGPRLFIVTRGAVTTAQGSLAAPERVSLPFQAAAWGLGRVIALEHPELSPRLLDLDLGAGLDENAAALVSVLQRPAGEDQLAYRLGRLHVPRLQPLRAPPSAIARPPLLADATYLITGGLGALGRAVARWMVAQGARHLVLIGRSEGSEAARADLDELRRAGATVELARADVAQAHQLAGVLTSISTRLPAVRGVVHAAGVLDDGVLEQQSWARFEAVLGPKAIGAWNLHTLTRDRPLDFFVLFSSMTSLLGSSGQANYAAANAVLDALAHHRRAEGLPASSINWGPWAEVGMAAGAATSRASRFGIDLISPQHGVELLGAVLQSAAPQTLVAEVDWSTYAHALGGAGVPPLLTELLRQRPATSPEKPSHDLLRRLTAATPVERLDVLARHVQAQASRVLGLDPSRPLSLREPLKELGIDSLMAVELRNSLAKAVDRSLSATLLYEYPTVEDLAAYLLRELFPEPDAPAPSTGPRSEARLEAEPVPEELNALTDEELLTRLDEKLDSILVD